MKPTQSPGRTLSRRRFIKGSAAVAAAAGVSRFPGLSARSYAQVIGSNEAVRIAVVGFNSRGKEHIAAYRRIPNCRLVALCDVDENVLHKTAESLARSAPAGKPPRHGPSTAPGESSTTRPTSARASHHEEEAPLKPIHPETYTDVRKLLDNKDIDAVSTATPNHWHSLIGIWACQAGKDAYVEKPISHNIWEGRKLVEAARKYDRVVAIGTQNRSNTGYRDAFEWVQAGNLGKILVSRGLCYKRRASIGKVDGPQPIPPGVDYNLWSGPRTEAPLMRKHLHYDWHWVWPTGNGDLGNQGVHQMDLARWALGDPGLAPRVISVGGRFGYVDDGTTPNTLVSVFDYGDALLIFEVRGLPEKTGSDKMDRLRGQSIGNIVECEGGYLAGTTAYDKDGKKIQSWEEPRRFVQDHFHNFVEAVRNHNPDHLHASVLTGHLSSALCHMGNLSYRLGARSDPAEIRDALKSDKAAVETLDRFEAHLNANGVDLNKDEAALGPMLKMDPHVERFVDNDKANELLKDSYRAPFVVPETV